MIKVGLVGFDTSHVVQFTKRLNHVDIEEDQWVEGAQVVAGFPGTSQITEQETIDEYTKQVADCGVEIVPAPEDLIGQIDAVMIEFQAGSVHLQQARPFIEAGLPTYVDKPFACSTQDAQQLVALAKANNVPIFSSSSLRYATKIQQLHADAETAGRILGAMTYSPASLHPHNPGLFNYGIHAVEPLYALMGPGCQEVWCVYEADAEVVVGRWADERIGSVRGTRAGSHAYGFTAWCENQVRSAEIDSQYIYRELLKRIVQMFQTGQPPVPPNETVEIVAFIEAAMKSAQLQGQATRLFA